MSEEMKTVVVLALLVVVGFLLLPCKYDPAIRKILTGIDAFLLARDRLSCFGGIEIELVALAISRRG